MKKKTVFFPASGEERRSPLNFPDCVYLSEHCRCSILCVDGCAGEKCSFRQSGREKKQSRDKWYQELNTLSEEEQRKIARSYYGGRMPWKARAGKQKGEPEA